MYDQLTREEFLKVARATRAALALSPAAGRPVAALPLDAEAKAEWRQARVMARIERRIARLTQRRALAEAAAAVAEEGLGGQRRRKRPGGKTPRSESRAVVPGRVT